MRDSTEHGIALVTARRYARLLIDWGFSAVEVVEDVATGERFVRCRNRCGQPRVVRTHAQFYELRDFEG